MSLNESKLIRKSRKKHQCSQCHLIIPINSSYTKHWGTQDGMFFDNKAHNECWDKWLELNRGNYDDEWYELWEEDNEEFNFNEWVDHIRERYDLYPDEY